RVEAAQAAHPAGATHGGTAGPVHPARTGLGPPDPGIPSPSESAEARSGGTINPRRTGSPYGWNETSSPVEEARAGRDRPLFGHHASSPIQAGPTSMLQVDRQFCGTDQ